MISFGVDLVTFFHPGFWGTAHEGEIIAYAAEHPQAFWTKMLDAAAEAGVEGIELTFPPFDWRGASAAFGSAEAFRAELEARGLRIASGFFPDLALLSGTEFANAPDWDDHIANALAYADFLKAMGSDLMVMGVPLRADWDAEPTQPVDLAYATRLASFCNTLGAGLLRKGVRLAVHPEAHSTMANGRDVDLLMLLTDPLYVSFCPDTAHLFLSGSDPVDVVTRHIDRLIVAHWKDALGRAPQLIPIDSEIHRQHRPFFCTLGQGRVDWPRWSRLLRHRGWEGWAILEVDAVPDPVDEIGKSLRFARQALLSASHTGVAA